MSFIVKTCPNCGRPILISGSIEPSDFLQCNHCRYSDYAFMFDLDVEYLERSTPLSSIIELASAIIAKFSTGDLDIKKLNDERHLNDRIFEFSHKYKVDSSIVVILLNCLSTRDKNTRFDPRHFVLLDSSKRKVEDIYDLINKLSEDFHKKENLIILRQERDNSKQKESTKDAPIMTEELEKQRKKIQFLQAQLYKAKNILNEYNLLSQIE